MLFEEKLYITYSKSDNGFGFLLAGTGFLVIKNNRNYLYIYSHLITIF